MTTSDKLKLRRAFDRGSELHMGAAWGFDNDGFLMQESVRIASELKADNDRLRDLVVKFQSGKPSTLFLEGHTGV